jgi:hypothetical protein
MECRDACPAVCVMLPCVKMNGYFARITLQVPAQQETAIFASSSIKGVTSHPARERSKVMKVA